MKYMLVITNTRRTFGNGGVRKRKNGIEVGSKRLTLSGVRH